MAEQGARVLVVEREHQFKDRIRGEFLTPWGGAEMQKLGLYEALANSDGMTPAELATKTGTTERYVREWLAAQAASGYVEYHAKTEKFSMLPEQAMALANEDSPVFLGAFGG